MGTEPELAVERTILQYELLQKLGEGGMGVVYKARDCKLDRLVAVKFLPKTLLGSPEKIARFDQEAKAIAALNHPNIATIYELAEANGERFLVLEYLSGGTLKEKLQKLHEDGERMPLGKLVDYALQIGDALRHAHKRGLTHRDVKSGNVMLTGQGVPKLTDFGLVKWNRGEHLTTTGNVVGTVAYMSPEQALGADVDQRSDIFSYGVVLYEMLVGKRPFQGSSDVGVLYEIVNSPVPAPKQFRADAPEALHRIVERALEKDREKRYQHLDELLEELRALKQENESKTHAPLAGPPAIGVLPFADLSPEQDQGYFCDGMAEELINELTKLEGWRVASRTSTLAFKGKQEDVRVIGQQLNVSVILEGGVRKAAEKLRITARLTNVADGYQLWSEKYDREMKDVFAVQDEVSQAIVEALRNRLDPGRNAVHGHPGPVCLH